MSGLVRIGTSVFEFFTPPDGVMEFQDTASALSYFRRALESKGNIAALRAYYFEQTGEAASRRTDHQILAWLSHQVLLGRVRIARVGPLGRGGALGEIASLLPEVGTAADTADATAGAAGAAAAAPPIAAIADEKESPTTTDHKIEVEVVNVKGKPQKNLPFEITLPDSSVRIGLTDAEGLAKQGVGPSTGTFTFRLPEQEPAEGAGDDPAVTAGATRIVRGGISLTIDTPALVEIPPRVFRGRLIGLLFDTDKTFLLPVSLNGIKGLKRFFDRNPGLEVLVVGHADTAGKKQHNLDLSVERSKSIAAYLADDVDFWLAFYPPGRPGSLAWGATEDKQMLKALGFETVKAFQQDEGLFDDGKAGPDTRRALITRYMKQDDTTLPAGTVVKTHGCGESHPDVPTLDSTPLQANRRVEIFLFEDKIDPPPRDACPSPAGCPEHAIWIARTVQTVDFDEKVGSLKVRVTDDKDNILKQAAVHISGPVTDDGQTDDDGDIDFESLPFGTYSIIAQKEGFTPGSGTATVGAPSDSALGGPGEGENATTIPLKTSIGSLAVSVRSSNGNVVVGAAVTIDGPVPKSGATDAAGLVTHNDVPSGAYTVTVTDPRFTGPPAATVQVPANANQVHNVVLTARAQLRLTVQDATTASPIGNAAVQLTGPGTFNAPTTPGGTVLFEAIPTGTYQVAVIPNNNINQNGNQSVVVALGPNAATILLPSLVPTNATITIAAPKVALVKKPGCTPRRLAVTLRTNQVFAGKARLDSSKPLVAFFTAATGPATIPADRLFDGAQLGTPAGVTIFAEGTGPSTAIDDITLTLSPQNVPGTVSTGTDKMTVVELTLELCESRKVAAGDPPFMPQNARINTGRFLHVQDPDRHHGRAMIIVREAKPPAFAGDLVLTPVAAAGGGAVQIFAAENPPVPPAAADAALGASVVVKKADIAAAPVVQGAKGIRFFVEASTVSAKLRDTGVQLGISGGDPDGDRAVVTSVRFTNFEAEVRSTPANTNRAPRFNNSNVPASKFRKGTAATPAAVDFEENYDANLPLVLVEDSVLAANPIKLSVRVAPANVPVSWSIQRDTRPTPDGDGAGVLALNPSAAHLPTLTAPAGATVANAATPLKATLLANGVGSFRVRPFVDGNGNNAFDRDPATATSFSPEPYLLMNLVLIRVQGFRNLSVGLTPNMFILPTTGAAPITGATGVNVRSGTFTSPGTGAGARNIAEADVVGGGAQGLRGLDRLHAGWVNQIMATPGSQTAPPGLDVFAQYRFQPAPLLPGLPTPAPVFRRSFMAFTGGSGTLPGGHFGPGDPAPVIESQPILDATNFANAGMGGNLCVGTEGKVGPPLAIVKNPAPATAANPSPPGQRWRVEMWDSPGSAATAAHLGGLTGNLVLFRFNLNFRCDLLFWTNFNVPSVPRPTPGFVGNPTAAAPDAACCLYSSVQTNNWTIRFEMTFLPAAPFTATETVARAMGMTQDGNPTRRAAPVEGSGLEVRFPVALNVLKFDARS